MTSAELRWALAEPWPSRPPLLSPSTRVRGRSTPRCATHESDAATMTIEMYVASSCFTPETRLPLCRGFRVTNRLTLTTRRGHVTMTYKLFSTDLDMPEDQYR